MVRFSRFARPSIPLHGTTRAPGGVIALVAFVALGALSGCVKVAAYQREQLAHPAMTTEDMSTSIDGHVRGVSEGAAGGLSAGGGGCGCN